MAGRYIALGPAGITRTTLAHEFGHILGFSDAYMRGFRDLGEDGYEILELVPNPDDIMAAPGIGRVQQRHFEALISVPGEPACHPPPFIIYIRSLPICSSKRE